MTETRPKLPYWKFLVPVAAIVAFVAIGMALIKSQQRRATEAAIAEGGEAQGLRLGAKLADFTLARLDGSSLQASELKSKIFLLNFWATWCEACVVEMPSIVALHESYKDKGLEILAVNVDDEAGAAVTRAVQTLKMPFPVYRDPEGKLAEALDVSAIPLTVVMTASREVLMIETGERNWNSGEMRSLMDEWLKK